MNIEDSSRPPLMRGGRPSLAVVSVHGRLCAPTPGFAPPAATRAAEPNRAAAAVAAIATPAVLWLLALYAGLGGCPSHAAPEPSEAQLIAIVRQYGAHLPRPMDPVKGRAVRVERTPREWVVTLIDPRRLDSSGRRYLSGGRRAYQIDRATLGVVAVAVIP